MRRTAFAALTAAVALTAATPGIAAATPAAPYATITGSGSSWQAVPIWQWANDIAPNGLTVNFLLDGSAAGRGDYISGTQVDFAASDVPFRNGHDKLGGTGREVSPWGYSYVPAVAGGIALVYHLTAGGRPIRDLRLSARTLMEIFTGQITNWDAPAITRDNGRRLPNLPITPVVHSDGAGTTYYFTNWLAHVFARQWNAFCARVTRGRVKAPCGPTEFYPLAGNAKAENGSNSVVDYVTSSQGNGAIAYVEYAYALNAGATVARLANPAGRYVLPAPSNVTRALTRALVDENPRSPSFLQENLANVYTYKNPASYPLSYYGYLIVPRSGTRIPPIFNSAAGRSLSTFVLFALCAGQSRLAAFGVAPLPRNLVAVGLKEVAKIPGHVAIPTLARCDRLPV
jgi:ABC-type phosphate transport system substrate-binding protein